MKKIFFLLLIVLFSFKLFSQEYQTISNIHYYDHQTNSSDVYINERCVLDLYVPKNVKNFPTVIWFHGGGLTGGQKEIPEELKNKGIAVVGVNYRLSPKVKAPKYIEDAAAATAWVFNNIKKYGGSEDLVFISGHSAGGYLAIMVGLDKSYLNKYKIDANQLAGIIPFSGQMISHFTTRKEKGIDELDARIDDMAPLHFIRADAPPLLLITGDREKELLGRYEENAYMWRMMKLKGHKETTLYELDGFDHGGMAHPAFPLLLNEIKRIENLRKRRG
ncbi:alpha/beta hydrolase fold domain-containing protein [Chryseobacterium sp. GMJ5]|uniref:Alpha/beta hydrolase fold domain-containing protein n=1 Tax=Chryseobacterium gilvum TaxID=2976534 RepID=A0ABT2VSQ7_9FLAO|nr:alpha/beta hydrolase fold domain-containing protein [Chryseobacterium gilvum]MCU7613023.1 alpha/beta hydrolase fold domain-containing protein [Chryseobacterium gilvum]